VVKPIGGQVPVYWWHVTGDIRDEDANINDYDHKDILQCIFFYDTTV
jgi:hypothetical protein